MKKSFSLLLVAGMLSLVACGPSEKEKAETEAHRLDSLRQDSIMQANLALEVALKASQDSLAQVAQDSIMKAMQDSIAMLTKKGTTPKTTKPKLIDPGKKDQKPEDVKPGTGRG